MKNHEKIAYPSTAQTSESCKKPGKKWYKIAFFGITRFLIDYVVQESQKNIFWNFRRFFESFAKNFWKIFLVGVACCRFVGASWCKNAVDQGLGTPQNCPTSQKIEFFKVRDMNTLMQSRKKKYENYVTSALKIS